MLPGLLIPAISGGPGKTLLEKGSSEDLACHNFYIKPCSLCLLFQSGWNISGISRASSLKAAAAAQPCHSARPSSIVFSLPRNLFPSFWIHPAQSLGEVWVRSSRDWTLAVDRRNMAVLLLLQSFVLSFTCRIEHHRENIIPPELL